jgi:hypothetical protein
MFSKVGASLAPVQHAYPRKDSKMDIDGRFQELIADMKLDGRYRTFIELERIAGEFPTAFGIVPMGKGAVSPCGAATTISA